MIKINKLTIPLIAFMVMVSPLMPVTASANDGFSIVAVVNKDAISAVDLHERIQFMMISAGMPNTVENQNRLKKQALDSLIDEQLKLQEAERQNLPITPEEINTGFKALADQNKITVEQFSEVIAQQGIPKSTLMNQIKAQIAWSKVIGSILRPKVNVSETDINAKLERLRENIGKTEYLVGEIFLPVENETQEPQVLGLAQKIIEEVSSGRAPFPMVAAQFSKAPEANQGGSLGWIQKEALAPTLGNALTNLPEGQMSAPIRQSYGYHLLMLQKKRLISEDILPSEEDVLNSIGLRRLDTLQQRYLSDLKSSAFLDKRV